MRRWPRQSITSRTDRAKARAEPRSAFNALSSAMSCFDMALSPPSARRVPNAMNGWPKSFDYSRKGPRQAQPEPDVAAEAPRGDQDHASNACGALEQQHLRDAASERVADDIDPLETEGLEPASDHLRVPAERVARIGALRQTAAHQVRHEDAAIGRKRAADGLPREMRIEDAVQEHHRCLVGRITQLGPMKAQSVDGHERMARVVLHSLRLSH